MFLPRFVRTAACGAALLAAALCAPANAAAQPADRHVSGRVSDERGAPVAGATLTLTPAAGGAEAFTVTDAAGRYSLAAGAGDRFELHARRIGFYALTAEVVFPPGAATVEEDLRLSSAALGIAPLEVVTVNPVTRPPAPRTPGGNEDPQQAGILSTLPLLPGDLNSIASVEPGVFSLGSDRGVVIGGQAPGQTSTTLDGATYGGASLPAEALGTIAVITSTFDPARGQFSGGQIAATTLSGTNLFGGAARVRFADPALQSGGAAQRAGQFAAFGGAGGALVPNRFFGYAAGEASRRWDPLLTLDNAGIGTLRSLGIDPGAAQRLREIVGGFHYPLQGVAAGARRYRDVASGLVRLDWAVRENHVLMARGDFRRTAVDGVGEEPFALSGSGIAFRERADGVLAQLTSFVAGGRNELRLSAREGRQERSPYLSLPAGKVLVPAGAAADDAGSALLRFGPADTSDGVVRTSLLEVSEEIAFPQGERHRMKVGFVANREGASRTGVVNAQGTFTFASLADLQAGRPSAFSRTLGESAGRAVSEYLAAYAGRLWRPNDRWSFIYGMRLEGRRYPPNGPAAAAVFGVVPGAVPDEWGVSPRFGFSYFPHQARWDVRGGVGEFRGKLPVGGLADALRQNGTGGSKRLLCVGAAVPAPDWSGFLTDSGAIPTACADGAPAEASSLSQVTLFDPRLASPRTWRAQVAWRWSGPVRMGNLGLGAELKWTRGLAQPLARDANFAGIPGFSLDDEAGRVVYVPVSAVDPESGTVGVAPSRRDPSLGTVRRVGSGGRSTVAEATFTSYLWTGGLGLVVLNYTWTRARDQVGELAAPWQPSSPLSSGVPGSAVGGVSDLERRHLVQAQYTHPLRRLAGEVGVVARLASGQRYTPQVDRDVNGDGLANDPAFVFDPAATDDAALRAGMQGLLAGPGNVRRCLAGQFQRVAARNRCQGPWTADLDLEADFWPLQERSARRLTLSLQATNLLAGADRLLHGDAGLRGWGAGGYPDATLLYVRGFDAGRRAYVYEVNHNFGRANDGLSLFGRPFTLTVQARWTFGADPVRQPLLSRVAAMRATGRSAAELRVELAKTVPNLAAQVLALNDTLRLALNPEQKARLTAEADTFALRLAPLVDSLATVLQVEESSAKGSEVRAARTRRSEMVSDAQLLLNGARKMIQQVLEPQQWSRLPLVVQQPARQIVPPRQGIDARRGDW